MIPVTNSFLSALNVMQECHRSLSGHSFHLTHASSCPLNAHIITVIPVPARMLHPLPADIITKAFQGLPRRPQQVPDRS